MSEKPQYISAWEMKTVNLQSPDKKTQAVVDNLLEYGMGSPTIGRLTTSNGMTLDYCSPSIVWSDDSRYLAVSQRTEQGFQQLLIIDVLSKKIGYVAKPFKVVELCSFFDNIIRGVNSPKTIALPFEIHFSDICWG